MSESQKKRRSGFEVKLTGAPAPLGRRSTYSASRDMALIAVLLVFGLFKGLRLPSRWAATQLQIDYSFGVIKRGLAGEAIKALGLDVERYQVVAAISGALLGVFVLTLGLFAVRQRLFADSLGRGLAVVFGSSFAVAYLAHLTGYLDLALAALALGAFAVPPRIRAGYVLVSGCVGVLVHEMYLIVFLPITLLPAVFDAIDRAPGPRRIVVGLLPVALMTLPAAATAVMLALQAPLHAGYAASFKGFLAARSDFPLRSDFFDVLARSTRDNLRIMAGLFGTLGFWREQFVAAVELLPPVTLMAWLVYRHAARAGWKERAAAIVTIMTGLAPLVMHVLGWDAYRWNTWAVFTMFVGTLLFARRWMDTAAVSKPAGNPTLIAVLVVIGLVSSDGFMDGYGPFTGFVEFLSRPVAAPAR